MKAGLGFKHRSDLTDVNVEDSLGRSGQGGLLHPVMEGREHRWWPSLSQKGSEHLPCLSLSYLTPAHPSTPFPHHNKPSLTSSAFPKPLCYLLSRETSAFLWSGVQTSWQFLIPLQSNPIHPTHPDLCPELSNIKMSSSKRTDSFIPSTSSFLSTYCMADNTGYLRAGDASRVKEISCGMPTVSSNPCNFLPGTIIPILPTRDLEF